MQHRCSSGGVFLTHQVWPGHPYCTLYLTSCNTDHTVLKLSVPPTPARHSPDAKPLDLRTVGLSYLVVCSLRAWCKQDGHSVHFTSCLCCLSWSLCLILALLGVSLKAFASLWYGGCHRNKQKPLLTSQDQDTFSAICWSLLFITITLGHCKSLKGP